MRIKSWQADWLRGVSGAIYFFSARRHLRRQHPAQIAGTGRRQIFDVDAADAPFLNSIG